VSRTVLMVARSILPHRTAGYQRITADLGAGLRRLGWDVTLLTTPVPGRPRSFDDRGLHVATVPGAWPEVADRHWRKYAPAVARRLDVESFDAVLGAGPAGHAVQASAPRSVFQCRDTFLHESGQAARPGPFGLRWQLWRPWCLRQIARELEFLRRSDAVVVGAPGTLQELAEWPYRTVMAAKPAQVVRSGVPTQRFRPDPEAGSEWRAARGIRANVPLVVTVSRLEPDKAVGDAVVAFRRFRALHRSAQHVVIGTGPEHGALRRQVMDLNLGRHVQLLGRLPDSDIVRWLQAADLFLFVPSQAAVRPPLNVIEALACGVPVVASSNAIDPAAPHPLLFPVAPSDPLAAARMMGRIWASRERKVPVRLPEAWTLEACARGYDAVLRGRRA
jgi:glycosyltransferase involved in cell wall biosynthesis